MSGWSLDEVAARVAADIPDGACVNLGIGLPERIADHIPHDREVIFHSENGILGMGPRPAPVDEDMELINAGKKPVTLWPPAAISASASPHAPGAPAVSPFAALAARHGRPLRVAILSDFTRIPYANGAVFQTRFLYQELRRCGHEVTVIGAEDPDAKPEELAQIGRAHV